MAQATVATPAAHATVVTPAAHATVVTPAAHATFVTPAKLLGALVDGIHVIQIVGTIVGAPSTARLSVAAQRQGEQTTAPDRSASRGRGR
jgi:hypothetical protein